MILPHRCRRCTLPGLGKRLAAPPIRPYFDKVTRVQNGTRISGNAMITGIANTDGFSVGNYVESTGVTFLCQIASIVTNTSITLNSSSCVTSSGTSPVRVLFYGYGAGGNISSIGVPDAATARWPGVIAMIRDRSRTC
jgi:hypothetical protein